MSAGNLMLRAGVALSFCLLLVGCSNDSKAAPSRNEVNPEPGVYQVDHPELFRVATVEVRNLPVVLTANGSVTPDVSRTIHVTSLGSGRVVELKTRLGDRVQKGQVLLVISSQDLAGATADYQKAHADEALASKALDRAQLLYSRGALAEKDLQSAQNAEDKAKVDTQTAEQRVKLLGGDPAHPSPYIELKAPVSGTIVEQNVAGFEGIKSLDNSQSLFTIADLSHVWILCDVYENDLGNARVGDPATIRLNAYPDQVFHGSVQDVSRVLDPSTRSAKVRIVLPNPDGLLKPGMFAVVTFQSRKSRPRLVVPATAIMRLQDKDWIFVKEGDQRFRKVEVHTQESLADGFVELQGGLKPGDQVIAAALEFSTAMASQGK